MKFIEIDCGPIGWEENEKKPHAKKSTTYGAQIDPMWLDVLLVPNAEFRMFVGNISAVWTG